MTVFQGKLYAATIDAKPRLVMRDLESGADRVLYTGLDYPPIWSDEDLDALPGYGFAAYFAVSWRIAPIQSSI